MPSKSLFLIIVLTVLLVSSVVFSLVRKPPLERKSLKVVVADTFPTDLSCEVYLGSFDTGKHVLGSKQLYIFKAEGKNEQIDRAEMYIGLATSIRVIRKDLDKDSYLLNLFLEGKDGTHFALFDLNLDGEWDVKKKIRKNFIRVENTWFEVDKIEGLTTASPTAKRGQTQYTYQKKWTSLPKAKPGK